MRRFILAVACVVSDRKCQDQHLIECGRFKDKGIAYEIWGPPKLNQRLQTQPVIVRRYFAQSDYWVAQICGGQFVPFSATTTSSCGAHFLQAQIALLVSRLNQELGSRLDHLKADWHRGRRAKVAQQLAAIRKDDTQWASLSPELQARVLRFQACIRIELEHDLAGARQLHTESVRLHPDQDDAALRSLLALYESGFAAAFDALGSGETPSARNFRAGLLLDDGRPREALAVATGSEPGCIRTRALALALTGDIDGATDAINSALATTPEWESVSFAAAAIDYLSAIAPCARPDRLPFAPEPLEWMLVLKDPGSQQRLAAAVARLERLLAECEGEHHRERYEAWLIACLANRVDDQERAIEYVRSRLQSSPGFWPAIIWSVSRGYEIDLDSCIRALQLRLADPEFECVETATLAACMIACGTPDEAFSLLESSEKLFLSSNAISVWLYWCVQALIRSARAETAEKLLRDRDPEQAVAPHAWSLILRVGAPQHADTAKERLFDLFERSSDAALLVDACELAAREHDWGWIAARANHLLQAIGTSDAIHLLAIAQYNSNDYAGALNTISKHAGVVGEGGLPAQLRRVRLAASNQVGLLSEAIGYAEALARESGDLEHWMELAGLLVQTGDTSGVCRVAQQLLSGGNLDSVNALRLAFVVKLEDRGLARDLIDLVLTKEIPDELVGSAYALGTEFNIGLKLRPIAERFYALGQRGAAGIRAVSFDQVVEMLKHWRKRTDRIVELYEEGHLPVHMVAARTRTALATLFGRQFSREDGVDRTAASAGWVLAYYGGRPPLSTAALPPDCVLRLHLDITTVLLAARLGTLGLLVKELGPLWIAKSTIPALQEMREQLTPAQPHRIAAAKAVLVEVERGAIVSVEVPDRDATDLERIRHVAEGLAGDCDQAVTFVAQCSTVEALPAVSAHLFSCGSVVESLAAAGPLSDIERRHFLDLLGVEAALVGTPRPTQGRPLLFLANTISVIAEAGLLPVVLERFPVRIEAAAVDDLRAQVDAAERARHDAEFVEELIAELHRRLADHTVNIIDERGAARSPGFEVEGPLDETLGTLLSFKHEQGDILVADDRFLNSYPSRGPVPITTLPELLSALCRAGKLREQDFYESLLRLRGGHARYLPLECGEIAYHLKAAATDETGVIETRALRILRRYVAGVLSAVGSLKPSDDPTGAHAEAAFVVGLRRAVHEAIRAPWGLEDWREHAAPRSGWVLANLYCPFHLLYRRARREEIADARVFSGFDLATLILEALQLQAGDEGPRVAYLNWLAGVIDEAVELEPLVLHSLVRTIKEGFKSALLAAERSGDRARGAAVMQALFDDLPILLQAELRKDAAFLNTIDIEIRDVIQSDGLAFDRDAFFTGASTAIDGGWVSVPIEGRGDGADFCPACTLAGQPAFSISDGSSCVVQSDPRLALLSIETAVATEAIRSHPEWLDGFGERRAELGAQLVGSPPRQRIDRAEELMLGSPALFYVRFAASARRRQAFDFSDVLALASRNLLSHFGLGGASHTGPDFEAAGDSLSGLYGPAEAFVRLAALPVAMPTCVIEAVVGMVAAKKRHTIHTLLRECRAPVGKLHLLRLLCRVADQSPAYVRLGRMVVHYILSDAYSEELSALLAGLRWIWDCYDRKEPDGRLGWERLVVAWGHAGQTVRSLLAAGASAAFVGRAFEQRGNRVVAGAFSGVSSYEDAAHPERQRAAQLLLTGLGYALDGSPSLARQCSPQLEAFFAGEAAGVKYPKWGLFKHGPHGTNVLGSFLGRSYIECFRWLIADEGSSGPWELAPDGVLAEAVGRLEARPSDPAAWSAISTCTDYCGPTEPRVRQATLRASEAIDLIRLWDEAPRVALQAIDVIRRTLMCERSELGAAQFLQQLVGLHRHRGEAPSGNPDLDEPLFSLTVNTGASLAIASAGKSAVEVFGGFLEMLVAASPKLLVPVRRVVENVALQLPASDAAGFWSTVVRLRGY